MFKHSLAGYVTNHITKHFP